MLLRTPMQLLVYSVAMTSKLKHSFVNGGWQLRQHAPVGAYIKTEVEGVMALTKRLTKRMMH